MALPFQITKDDILQSRVLVPGWYKATVKKVSQEPDSKGEATNTWIYFVVEDGPVQKDGEPAKGTPCRRCFSEKAPGFAIPYLIACGLEVGKNGGNFDIEKTKGQTILIYIENRMWEGKLQNDVKDFKAAA